MKNLKGSKNNKAAIQGKTRIVGLVLFGLSAIAMLGGQAASAAPSWGAPSWANPSSDSPRAETYPATEQRAAAAQGTTQQRGSSRHRASRPAPPPFAPDSHNFGLAVGQVFLLGDLGNRYDDNLGLQADYTYGASERFGFIASLGYSNHTRESAVRPGYSQLHLQTGLRMNLARFDEVIPYGQVGLGFYRSSMGVSETSSVSGLLFGMHFGGGVDLRLSDQYFFGAGLTMQKIFSSIERTPNGPVELGGTFTSFLARVGVAL